MSSKRKNTPVKLQARVDNTHLFHLPALSLAHSPAHSPANLPVKSSADSPAHLRIRSPAHSPSHIVTHATDRPSIGPNMMVNGTRTHFSDQPMSRRPCDGVIGSDHEESDCNRRCIDDNDVMINIQALIGTSETAEEKHRKLSDVIRQLQQLQHNLAVLPPASKRRTTLVSISFFHLVCIRVSEPSPIHPFPYLPPPSPSNLSSQPCGKITVFRSFCRTS